MKLIWLSPLLVIGLSISASAQSWQQSPVNSHWYVLTNSTSWNGAEIEAVAWGGHLVTIRSQAENDWIVATYTGISQNLWIGFEDWDADSIYQWVSGESVVFTNWAFGEPNHLPGEWTAELQLWGGPLGRWNDQSSYWSRPGVVELDSPDCNGNGLPDAFEIATNPSLDQNGNGILDVCEFPGFGFCFGDPGVGTPCPCGDNDGSVPGSGCDNGVFASGARLTGSGDASITNDTLVLTTTGLEPNNWGLYFQGDNLVAAGSGSPFGDGLRCTGGSIRRIQARPADGASVSSTTITISAKVGNISAGDTKRYQCWYRTQVDPPCGLGLYEFNLSNGYEITWQL